MKLRVMSCTQVLLDEDVAHVTVEDLTGSLGIRPGHAPLVTALVPGILIARGTDGKQRYVAVDGGVLTVTGDEVRVASRQAVVSGDLQRLEDTVVRQFETQTAADRANHTAFEKMRISFMRRVLEFDQAGEKL